MTTVEVGCGRLQCCDGVASLVTITQKLSLDFHSDETLCSLLTIVAELDAVIVFKLSAMRSQSEPMLNLPHAPATWNSSWN